MLWREEKEGFFKRYSQPMSVKDFKVVNLFYVVLLKIFPTVSTDFCALSLQEGFHALCGILLSSLASHFYFLGFLPFLFRSSSVFFFLLEGVLHPW